MRWAFLSVWTGGSGDGKSTFLGQELLTAINHGFNVCAYSGELPAAALPLLDRDAGGRTG